jgi:hypothetical protein
MGNFGGSMVPGLEVVELKPSSVVLRRVGPEMRVNSDYKAGYVYAVPYAFVSGEPIVAEADGVSVKVTKAERLQPGDFVNSNGQVVRVLAVAGGVVTFSQAVTKGPLVSVTW